MPTDCQGTWCDHAYLADDTIPVQRCNGCGELLAIHRGRGFHFDAGTTERTILTTIWEAFGRSVDEPNNARPEAIAQANAALALRACFA